MKDYKISETEANRVLVKNYNDRPNALASYGQAKKTGEQTKDIFDRQFQLVKEKHNLLADATGQGFAAASEQMAKDKQELKQDISNLAKAVGDELDTMQTVVDEAKQVADEAAETADGAVVVAEGAVGTANEAKGVSANAVVIANEAKSASANAAAVAKSADNVVRGLEHRMNSGEFKGEKGDPFTVSKVYASVAEMEADFANEDVPEGAFVVIETGNVEDEENARLYIKGADKFSFVTDLSGAQGMQGPQGPEGKQGPRGYTGPKGDAYSITDEDKDDIAAMVLAALPTWEGGSY